MTQEHLKQREKRLVATRKVIEEVRKLYPFNVEPKTLRDKLNYADRTVDDCLKRGVEMGVFKRVDRGQYSWIPFDENIMDRVGDALSDLRDLFKCFNIPINYISTHPLVRRPPELIREVLFNLRWHDPTAEEVNDFQRKEHDLAMRASSLKYEGRPRNIGDIREYQIIKQEGDITVTKEIPYPNELIDRVKRFTELYPERVGKTLGEVLGDRVRGAP